MNGFTVKNIALSSLLLASLSAFASSVLAAELRCAANKSFQTECLDTSLGIGAHNQLLGPNDDPISAAKQNTASLKRDLLSQLQGLVMGSISGSASTSAEDFLSTVAVTLPDLSNGIALTGAAEPTDETLNMEWTAPLCSKCLKVSLDLARGPKISAGILESIAEPDRATAEATLTSDLTSLDDYTLKLSYSHQGEILGTRYGRSPDQYLNKIRIIHSLEMIHDATTDRKSQNFMLKLQADNVITPAQFASLLGTPGAFEALPKATQDRISAEFASYFSTERIDTTGAFIKAIDNQPQLIFSGSQRKRDERIGPTENSLSLRFEFSSAASFNNVLASSSAACFGFSEYEIQDAYADARNDAIKSAQLRTQASKCITQVQRGLSETVEERLRWALTVEYKETEDHNFMLAAPAINYSAPGSRSTIASLTVGKRLPAQGSLGTSRFDMEFSYEDVSKDPMRNDRSKLTATWSLQFGQATIPISIIYANRPELDLGNVDSQIGAQIGIKYDIDQLFDP